ncbi:MAG: glutamate decarboxylase [Firmicutes bacterium]|nr:glutamate decarboxylase [Bacillota bacterium]
MWTVIYIASTQKLADRICERLLAEGCLAKQRQASTTKQQFEILVPEAELDDVKELLTDILHSSYS